MNDTKTYACPFCGKRHDRSTAKCPEKNKPVPDNFKLEGETLGKKYRLEKRIAEGGMGVIYEGTHLTIGRKLAVKVLHTGIRTQDDVVTRFQNEARLTAAIGHRNIVDILDMGKFRRKFYFIVMEFLEGEDLRMLLMRREVLSRKEAVDLTLQVLNGLKAAHLKGIIHRDLKPENIFIVKEPSGEKYVKILDFGVSRLIDTENSTDVRLTISGMVFGTPRYIPPEQAKGKTTVDHRADLYSTGALLYEMLCGYPLCLSDNYNELMVEILTKTPIPAIKRRPNIPAALSAIVMKSVDKRPAERYQSADAFMRVLVPFSSQPEHMSETFADFSLRLDEITGETGLGAGEGGAGTAEQSAGPEAGGPSEAEKKALEALKRMDTMPPQESPVADMDDHEPGGMKAEAVLPAGRTAAEISTLRPSESRMPLMKRRGFLVMAIPLLFIVVLMSLFSVIMVYIDKKVPSPEHRVLINRQPGTEGADFAEVVIKNLPESAMVYIDDILHPERPVAVEKSTEYRMIKIVVDAKVMMEEKIVIPNDVSVPFTCRKEDEKTLKPSVEVTGEKNGTTVKKGAAGKKKKKKKGKSTREIDEDYPEL